ADDEEAESGRVEVPEKLHRIEEERGIGEGKDDHGIEQGIAHEDVAVACRLARLGQARRVALAGVPNALPAEPIGNRHGIFLLPLALRRARAGDAELRYVPDAG